MKVDGSLTDNLPEIPTRARDLETSGYDGAFTVEGPHDPFLPVLLAAEHTERLELSTAIAVAFARNPMTLAQTAYDLQLVSEGRFILGHGDSHLLLFAGGSGITPVISILKTALATSRRTLRASVDSPASPALSGCAPRRSSRARSRSSRKLG